MRSIFSFFESIWDGVVACFAWVVRAPILIISAVTGIYSAISASFSSLTVGTDYVEPVLTRTGTAISQLGQWLDSLPDIAKLALYCMSFDVLFDFITSFFGVFLTLLIATITLLAISIPAYFAIFLGTKWGCRLVASFMPAGFVPNFIVFLANYNPANPFRFVYDVLNHHKL